MKDIFKTALLEFDKLKAEEILRENVLEANRFEDVFSLITESLTELGEEWVNGDIALSQIYLSSRICEELVDELIPDNFDGFINAAPIGIVTLMDYHLLGKKIVYSIMRSSGFYIIDFGGISSIDDLIDQVIMSKTKILLISTLMYHSALRVKDVKEAFEKRKLDVKILVGGAPFAFDNQLWKQVGADAMGVSPADGISVINKWLGRV